MTEAASPPGAAPPGPAPIALAIAQDLVTRYRLRLADRRDSRMSGLGDYELAAAAWTGPRAALVAFYDPPSGAAEAGQDLAVRCDAARRWGHERLRVQGAQACDILLVALRPVTGAISAATQPDDPVRVGAAWVDVDSGGADALLPIPPGLPSAGELRAKARAVRDGAPVPTLAAVDLAERQTVAGGYVAPVRRAMVRQPYVTYGLIATFVVIYLLQRADPTVTVVGVGYNGPPLSTDWYRYVSSAFLHDPTSYLHIIFNCLAMLWIGRLVEQLYGRLVLVGAFVLTAVLGSVVWVVAGSLGLAEITPSLGASGGISGLVGLLLMLGVVQGKNVPVGISRSIRSYALIVIVLNLIFGLGLNGVGGGTVNNWVHGGGLAAGILVGLAVPPVQQIGGRDLAPWQKVALAAIIAAAAVALAYFAYQAVVTPPPPPVPG
ncbi:MAG: rhomboid family intramembrane serine protease [Candidatus Dormibacteraeota bacterium]|nr:rhomboid family intramembrane serine protease [Candidatus Dormibacteraeota bacterium]MBV9524911.1 rhomboid family intramembrane serine protease [Candidatus Dormibacteraeota bacterium]